MALKQPFSPGMGKKTGNPKKGPGKNKKTFGGPAAPKPKKPKPSTPQKSTPMPPARKPPAAPPQRSTPMPPAAAPPMTARPGVYNYLPWNR